MVIALASLLLMGTGIFLSQQAHAQNYPNHPVKIIVPFATGGPADNYARFIAQRLQENLGQSFVVDKKPGAGSVIGTDLAAKAQVAVRIAQPGGEESLNVAVAAAICLHASAAAQLPFSL